MGQGFASGKQSIAFCDRCSQKYPYNKLKPLTINRKTTDLRVCPECWEPDQPQYRVGELKIFDPQALQNARPDPNLVESRDFQWGWDPVGFSNPYNFEINDNLEATGSVGSVTITTS